MSRRSFGSPLLQVGITKVLPLQNVRSNNNCLKCLYIFVPLFILQGCPFMFVLLDAGQHRCTYKQYVASLFERRSWWLVPEHTSESWPVIYFTFHLYGFEADMDVCLGYFLGILIGRGCASSCRGPQHWGFCTWAKYNLTHQKRWWRPVCGYANEASGTECNSF